MSCRCVALHHVGGLVWLPSLLWSELFHISRLHLISKAVQCFADGSMTPLR